MLKKVCLYIAIPLITVFIFRLIRAAQGERLEEIIGGIMVGVLIDLIVSIGLAIAEYKQKH
jgi:hypothetical protein